MHTVRSETARRPKRGAGISGISESLAFVNPGSLPTACAHGKLRIIRAAAGRTGVLPRLGCLRCLFAAAGRVSQGGAGTRPAITRSWVQRLCIVALAAQQEMQSTLNTTRNQATCETSYVAVKCGSFIAHRRPCIPWRRHQSACWAPSTPLSCSAIPGRTAQKSY